MVLPVEGRLDDATEAEADLHPLIVFHPDAIGRPLVLLRNWSRESVYHQSLARALGPARPILSFGPPAHPDPARYPITLDDWVDHFLDAIDRAGVREFDAIGGWSFGGTIALRAAEVLKDRGVEIPHVLMIDARMPMADPRRKPGSIAAWYKRVMSRPRKAKRAIRRALGRLAGSPEPDDPADRAPEERLPPGQKRERAPSGYEISPLARSVQSAFVRYRPRPTRLPLRLLWTRFSQGYTPGDPTLGWGAWAEGELDVVAIPGGHWSMFAEPNLQVVADALRDFLDRAPEPSTHASPTR